MKISGSFSNGPETESSDTGRNPAIIYRQLNETAYLENELQEGKTGDQQDHKTN